jgi:glycosyltransferase involved in cell wall biosynthesis
VERHFDVVHVHNPFGVAMPIIAVMRSKAPVTVATIHSVVPDGYKPLRLMRRPLQIPFARLDTRIAVSEAVVDSIKPHFPGLSFEVIPNGVDTDFFSPKAEPLPHLADGMPNGLRFGEVPRGGALGLKRRSPAPFPGRDREGDRGALGTYPVHDECMAAFVTRGGPSRKTNAAWRKPLSEWRSRLGLADRRQHVRAAV